MQNPEEGQQLTCPENASDYFTPTKVWRSELPSGARVWYGILPEHKHSSYGDRCDYSGHVTACALPKAKG